MPTTVDCPACQRALRVPDHLLGKQVQCPSCGGMFAAGAVPTASVTPFSERETQAFPPGAMPIDPATTATPAAEAPPPAAAQAKLDVQDHEYCRRCNEQLQGGERRCRHCGEELDDQDDRPWEEGEVRRDSEPHRGPLVLTLGIASLVCGAISMGCPFVSPFGLGLGIPTWVMGHRDLKKMRLGEKDPRGESQTRAGWICGIVGTALSILGVIILVFWIVLEVYAFTTMIPAMRPRGSMSVPATNSAPAPNP